jgi:hypothetical protein
MHRLGKGLALELLGDEAQARCFQPAAEPQQRSSRVVAWRFRSLLAQRQL